jgi:hypothetical protein
MGKVETGLERIESAKRRGRRFAIVVFGLIVGGITALWALQIIGQVWFPEVAGTVDCREGLRSLVDSVRRARTAAAEETGGERRAMARFRAELEEAWSRRPAIGAACESDPDSRRALADVDRLRFAEEHAVRYEAVDLARRRRRVQALEKEFGN